MQYNKKHANQSDNQTINQTGNLMNHDVKNAAQSRHKSLKKSKKLQNVCYDIRGPLLKTANRMEADGHRIIKLNVGNPAPFGLYATQSHRLL